MKKLLLLAMIFIVADMVNATTDLDFSYCSEDLAPGCLDTRELPDFWHEKSDKQNTEVYLERERVFSKYSWKYAIASSIVYEPEVHEEPFPDIESLGWTNILCSTKTDHCIKNEEPEIGFYADAWVTDSHELVISFRGTDSLWKDFLKGNLVIAPLIFGRTQFNAALDFSTAIIEQAKMDELEFNRITFTGHSLGGGLAQYSQRFFEDAKSIVFDPSPNRGRIISLFTRSDSQPYNATRVYEKGEILELLRKGLDPDINFDWAPDKTGKSTIWMDFYTDDPVKAHSIRDLAMSLVKVSAIDGHHEARKYMDIIRSKRMKAP
ncbi:Mbeg1-like protein [Microbulbifer sp.]|uniref:Mbeg1-like protein n=1 Tax=Microbulbifer sp. TaxID=1908541 RepID=UPI00258C2A00|nr:Mbeg1-like protein [Microbulbifer sp.]